MPSELLKPDVVAPRHPELLSFLKGRDNPFDLFVAARKPDTSFSRYHVPSIHREVFEPLSAVVNRYRLTRLECESDLPRSGVLVIQGIRGMGKTHMVHALQKSAEDGSPRIVVAPAIYEPHRPFIEYLLHQLVRHFQNETDGQTQGTLDLLADALARQILVQAFHGMTEVEWLGLNVTGRSTFWQFLWGIGAERLADRKRLLITDLEQWENRTILEVCERHEQEPQLLCDIALKHIQDAEPGHTLAGQIRRGLYARLVQLAFGGPRESIYEFLLDGYTEVEAKTQPSRQTLVDELFQSLLELCLLAGMPVIFAFDALETLLGDPPVESLCHPFFKGLADVLDSHRGIPFLLFAELGHWEQATHFLSTYAGQRFQQGVMRVPKYGSLSVLKFPQVSAKQLEEIVAARMKPLLTGFYESEKPDAQPTFPFTEEDLRRIARSGGNEPPLRQALQALRDRYDELVNGLSDSSQRAKTPLPSADSSLIESLETCWQRELRAARRRLEASSLGTLADDLHAGISKWVECLIAEGTSTELGRPMAVSNLTLGTHPSFGQVTKVQWAGEDDHQEVGVGLLLGERRAMPRDLETKLKMLASSACPFEILVLLWPRGAGVEGVVQDHFPTATRAIWDQYAQASVSRKIRLRAIAPEQLVPWLALPCWLNAIRTEVEGASADLVHHFVAERTASIYSLVSPRS
jgi:hypothetical protein